jgi:superfamily II DNA helicase RecQ
MEEEESKEKRIEKALERVHGVGSVWRSEEQKMSVSAIVEGASPVVCILLTGGGKTMVEQATVVVVVSNMRMSQEFTLYVQDLFLRECLGSLYFDEAHTLRTERHFRQKFELFRKLTLAVPWIFLTATLPSSMAAGFEESLAVTKP